MVKRILFIAVLLLSVVSFQSQARTRITYGDHQKIEKVATLPDSTYYETENGKHIDLGCIYTVFEVCAIPIYIKEEGRLVGFEGDTYYDLDDEMTTVIKQDIQVEELESLNKIPFWDRWGGKLTIVGIIAIIILYYFIKGLISGRKEEEEENDETPNEEKKTEE